MVAPAPARRRLAVGLGAALVAGVDLSAKVWAGRVLHGREIGRGPMALRLERNSGVAFSFGAGAPVPLVVTLTAVATAALGVSAWRGAASMPRVELAALTLTVGGATANVIDRAADGVVTDYLHVRWWPTFNLADTAIITGAVLWVLNVGRGGASHASVGHRRAIPPSG